MRQPKFPDSLKGLSIALLLLTFVTGAVCYYVRQQSYLDGSVLDSPNVGAPPAASTQPKIDETDGTEAKSGGFLPSVVANGVALKTVCPPNQSPYNVLLRAYGAIFLAGQGVKLPPSCLMDYAQTAAFQSSLQLETRSVGGVPVRLQAPAMKAFLGAVADAKSKGIAIEPIGETSSFRDYSTTVEFFQRNLADGLLYWVSQKKIADATAKSILIATPKEQLEAALALEKKGLFLHANRTTSILFLTAPPGASQHLSGLAVDVKQHESAMVQKIMLEHGFFQTVKNDFTHFTFLGLQRSVISSVGLEKVVIGGRDFYSPKL